MALSNVHGVRRPSISTVTRRVKSEKSRSASISSRTASRNASCSRREAVRARGGRGYLKRFITPVAFMLPLLVLDEFIKPASLALRLFGNIFGEETVTEELYNLLPIGAPALMMALSLLFCAIQAVVFTMLVSIYLDEGIEIEEA